MSDSRNTNKARQARALVRAHLRLTNQRFHRVLDGEAPSPADIDFLETELRLIVNHGGGKRYGNHRKWKAAEKVQKRRNARHTLNSTTKDYDHA